MRTDTLFQICFYFIICMLIFSVSVNFVVASGFYGDERPIEGTLKVDDDGNTIVRNLTGQDTSDLEQAGDTKDSFDFGDVFAISIGTAVVGAILIGWLFKDARILGIYIFGIVFWAAYINAFSILGFGGGFIPAGIEAIIHGTAIFTFIGAIVGMFTNVG